MNTVIRSIRSPRTVITQDRLESTQEKINSSLLSGESVFDGDTAHSFDDVLLNIWVIDSSAELIDAELKSIALGKSKSLDTIREILTGATYKYAEKITEKVALHILETGINHFVENLDTDELKNIRGNF